MSALFLFSAEILLIAGIIWGGLAGLWHLGLWRLNQILRKRGEYVSLHEEKVRNAS